MSITRHEIRKISDENRGQQTPNGHCLARTCMRAREKSLKNFGPDPTVSSLTLRRYGAGHADGAASLVGAALTSVAALSVSAAAVGLKNERARVEPAPKRIETQLHRCRT